MAEVDSTRTSPLRLRSHGRKREEAGAQSTSILPHDIRDAAAHSPNRTVTKCRAVMFVCHETANVAEPDSPPLIESKDSQTVCAVHGAQGGPLRSRVRQKRRKGKSKSKLSDNADASAPSRDQAGTKCSAVNVDLEKKSPPLTVGKDSDDGSTVDVPHTRSWSSQARELCKECEIQLTPTLPDYSNDAVHFRDPAGSRFNTGIVRFEDGDGDEDGDKDEDKSDDAQHSRNMSGTDCMAVLSVQGATTNLELKNESPPLIEIKKSQDAPEGNGALTGSLRFKSNIGQNYGKTKPKVAPKLPPKLLDISEDGYNSRDQAGQIITGVMSVGREAVNMDMEAKSHDLSHSRDSRTVSAIDVPTSGSLRLRQRLEIGESKAKVASKVPADSVDAVLSQDQDGKGYTAAIYDCHGVPSQGPSGNSIATIAKDNTVTSRVGKVVGRGQRTVGRRRHVSSIQHPLASKTCTNNPFICGICAHTFPSAANLLNHLKYHRDAATHPCAKCPRDFQSRSHLVDHAISHTSHRPHKCHICDKTFKRHRDRNAHQRACEEKERTCKKPGEPSKAKTSRKIKDPPALKPKTNTEENTYQCETCTRSFSREVDLYNHRVRHSNERPYVCGVCGVTFKRTSDLGRHNLVHDLGQYVCKYCCDSFHEKTQLKTHIRDNHGGLEKLAHALESPPYRDTQLREANALPRYALKNPLPRDTQLREANALPRYAPKSPLPRDTELREANALPRYALTSPLPRDTQLREASALPRCSICGASFQHCQSLSRHMVDTHMAELPFRCIACEERFLEEAALTEHCQASHPEAPHACDVCEERFCEEESLEDHKKLNHENEGLTCILS